MRRAFLTTVLVLLLLPAAAAAAPCPPKRSKEVTGNRYVSVFQIGNAEEGQMIGCDRRTKRRYPITDWDEFYGHTELDHFTVAGRFAALAERYHDFRSDTRDFLLSVSELHGRDRGPLRIFLPVQATLVDVDLARDGRFAYLLDTPSGREVWTRGRRLDAGDPATIGSLVLSRGHAIWQHRGERRSAPLR